ncbi:hypothetical protein [Aquabacterium sp.]|uniref:hypothetical protein n=1 Tax=Aquabacterium sp. TaxID=1872578 RepID=UPI0025BEF686|nr:hypothetical protein [Aquabacterium sp.]
MSTRPDAVSFGASPALLKGPVRFPMRTGLFHAPRLRRVVQVLPVGMASWMLVWGAALWHEHLVWGGPWWRLALGNLIVLVCLWRGLGLWRTAQAPGAPLSLDWMGPLPRRGESAADAVPGGWHVRAWGYAVDVRCLLDAQGGLLLEVRNLPGAERPRCVHVWVPDAPDRVPGMGARELQRLRALLALPSAMTRHRHAPSVIMPQALSVWSGSMASWAPKVLSGAFWSSHTMNKHTPRTARQEQGRQASPVEETAFAPTEILPDRRSV